MVFTLGPYASEMTMDEIVGPEHTKLISQCVLPVPAARGGKYVLITAVRNNPEPSHSATEMAGTVVYLASAAGAYTSGQEIIIDGGACAVNPSTI